MLNHHRTALTELRQALDRLEAVLASAGQLPPLHETRVLLRLNDYSHGLEMLADMTERLSPAGKKHAGDY